ncbi:MAG: pseudouridine synthase [Butyrivibrio sp.]|nr:pseudouridine synthase [Butyrivibrio sp.]
MDERINKFLSSAGFCSRREADRLVAEGRVTVDGQTAFLGTRVSQGARVLVDGRGIDAQTQRRVFALYKPAGYISSLSDSQGEGIARFIPPQIRLYPVGRLDRDSEGLMLLTNDGGLMNEILKAAGGHEKEYRVTVDKRVTGRFLRAMEDGVPIRNSATGEKIMTAPCKTRQIGEKEFFITLTQGLNRQIRRMCGYFGYKVESLQRIRIMNITLDGLSPGQLREICGEELIMLKGMTEYGQNGEN